MAKPYDGKKAAEHVLMRALLVCLVIKAIGRH